MAVEEKAQYSAPIHRLPTLTAADALNELDNASLKPISLGLSRLDSLLRGRARSPDRGDGFSRGQVLEVFGPPGVGKTTLCMHATAAALHSGSKVIWIDTATPLVGSRLERILSTYEASCKEFSEEDPLSRSGRDKMRQLSYYHAPTLSHLLFLLSSPSVLTSSPGPALLVIDSLSVCIDNDYPRNIDVRYHSSQSDHSRWLCDRRPAMIAEVISRLTKLSSTKNVAIFLTTNAVTKIRAGTSALLRPALSGQEWDISINFRLAMYQDWLIQDQEHTPPHGQPSAHFIELISPQLNPADDRTNNVAAFGIDERGMYDMLGALPASTFRAGKVQLRQPHKRRHEEITDQTVEASDSDYGWDEDDDHSTAEDLADALAMENV